MKYLLDTNICIYALKNRPPEVLAELQRVGRAAVAVSVITVVPVCVPIWSAVVRPSEI